MTTRVCVFVLTVGALCLVAGCTPAAPQEGTSETVVPAEVQAAEVGNIRAVIHVTGVITSAPGAELVVVAPQPARVVELPKAEGDRVTRGDVLVRFEIPSTSADATRQRSEVARAQARIENAKAAQARAHGLFERGIAARKEMEDADRELLDAQADLAGFEATRAAADTVAARSTVLATFDGVVAKRFHNPGDLVDASASDPVLRIIDPRRLEVTASIPIADVSRTTIGASARLIGAADGSKVTLKVVSRPTLIEPGTAAAPVRLAFVTPASFAVGTPVQLDIDAEEHKKVVLVPTTAIVREGAETAVFVAVEGKAQRRPLTVGLSNDTHVEVLSNLKPGELVITRGQAGLPDGAAIRIEK